MSERLEMRLEVVPGLVKAAWTVLPGKVTGGSRSKGESNAGAPAQEQQADRPLSLKVPVWHASRRKEILRSLALSPGEVFALLQGRLTGELAELELLPTDRELEQALGEGVEHKAETLRLIKERLAEEPLLALSLRGFTKGELLDGIFALWAEGDISGDEAETEEEEVSVSDLFTELARLERKGPAITSGEWLAEAAAEGSLHQPGPQFHEIAARPFPSPVIVAEVTEDWETLLPQTPKAIEGLTLIMQRVAESAARRAKKGLIKQ
ncbi:hypothetical protein [Paenibacillus etheri]|uniref:Uncharacterized protein n=1 Tax=Paenibacillus etheri TaxID=1306852 RepID=A0A0W1AQG2_9BACL|nr:hypothetical protein [Paenibacillus etheri]KTD83490.1 hypothetical protein UQ64_02320 [Paenibacillus etheri]